MTKEVSGTGATLLHGAHGAAAVLLHDDSSGDCRVFTQQLTSLARDRYGVKVHYGVEAVRLSSDETRILAVEAADGRRFEADLFVVCTGPHVELLETANVHLPIYPVKGFSLDVPIQHPTSATLPRYSIVHEEGKKYVSRVGDSMRISGFAELHGFDRTPNQERHNALASFLSSVVDPSDLDWTKARYYNCLRPVSPDDMPLIGRVSTFSNLLVNLGHGSVGWTLGPGSGFLLSQIAAEEVPAVDPRPFAPGRFAQPDFVSKQLRRLEDLFQ